MCCVDKKGILSWPNPSAEKIFFLRSSEISNTPKKEEEKSDSEPGGRPHGRSGDGDALRNRHNSEPIAEILDITQDSENKLHFDCTSWQDHISNLKPLGLNILLNTCNDDTRVTYSSFHSHLSHEVFCNKAHSNHWANDEKLIVPVTSRRCLCEVAKMIGFVDSATSAFKLEQQLCSFRHIESDELSRDRFKKAKIKFPFPHMMGVLVKEKASQSLQLMAQVMIFFRRKVCFWVETQLVKPFRFRNL